MTGGYDLAKLSPTGKVFLFASVLISCSLVSLLAPHAETEVPSLLNNSVQMFLFVLCIFMTIYEPTKRNKWIFGNFSLVFGFSILFHLHIFITEPMARMMWFQYVGTVGYYSVMTLAISYVTIDLIFRSRGPIFKYLLAVSIVGCFVVSYYYPFLVDPRYIYDTAEAQDFAEIQTAFDGFGSKTDTLVSPREIASHVKLYSWEENKRVSELSPSETLARVVQLYPYVVTEHSYAVLLARPWYLSIISMCVVALGFIFLFFAYQYLRDPPQGAYIEKIMFLFLIFFTVEILHSWSYIKSIEWSSFYDLVSLGHGISMIVLLMIGFFFLLRLRFITSPNGQFYEQELVENPTEITRWRDMFDEMIIAHFLNNRRLLGRFFVDRNRVS